MAEDVKFDGQEVKLGAKKYIVPSLSVKQAKLLWPQILELDKGITIENLPTKWEIAIPIIHAALKRNYPNLSQEEVEEFVDIKNLRQLLLIVSGQSGIQAGENGPDVAEKETQKTTETAVH